MQQSQVTRPFDFPYLESFSFERDLILADFDVVGVQGPRLKRLQKLHSQLPVSKKFQLSIFEGWVPPERKSEYDYYLKEFLAYFTQVEIVRSSRMREEEFINRLGKSFSRTMNLLGDYSERLMDEFFQTFPQSHWLMEDQMMWWSTFVKAKFHHAELTELAQYEAAVMKLDFIDLPVHRLADIGQVYLNPTVQLVKLEKAAGYLNKKPGIWIVYKNRPETQVLEMQLNTQAAQIMDVLGEERKFSTGQLVDWLQQESEFLSLEPLEILSIIESLKQNHLLIDNALVT